VSHHWPISGTTPRPLESCEGLLSSLVSDAMDLESKSTLFGNTDHLRESRGAMEQNPSVVLAPLPSSLLLHSDGEDRRGRDLAE
jgi:hypothetical protein